jgi:hypothetical protein
LSASPKRGGTMRPPLATSSHLAGLFMLTLEAA